MGERKLDQMLLNIKRIKGIKLHSPIQTNGELAHGDHTLCEKKLYDYIFI